MKALLLARGGVRSFERTLADGEKHTLYYNARTPAEVAAARGAIIAGQDTEQGMVNVDRFLAKFLLDSMCNEDGTPLLTKAEASQIPNGLKMTLALSIVQGSEETGSEELKKD